MAIKTNIKIITFSGRKLDYATPESLNIRFNRIADDAQDPSTRFGEFSYSFSLPMTKNNNEIFGYANTPNKRKKFSVNPIDIRVFNNDALLMDGTLELTSIKVNSYECVFYSKLTELIDVLGDLNLNEVTVMPQIANWNEEATMRYHINQNYANSDEADYQFPLVYYNTWFTPLAAYQGMVDFKYRTFRYEGDRPQQNYYYLLNTTQNGSSLTDRYMHEFPLCFYLKTVVEGVLAQVGWSLSGSFWEDPDIKRIIMLYTGDNDIYDSARYVEGGVTYLDTNLFLPKYKAKTFIKDIVNMFNLYLRVDVGNKIIAMETYDVMFASKIDAYDITNKILKDTIEISAIEEYDFSVTLKDSNNGRIMGDNYTITSSGNNALTATYTKTNETVFANTYNHVGESDTEISTGFAAPCVKRMYLRNTDNYNGTITFANDVVVFLPNMSDQTPQDNSGNKFNKASGDTKVYNEEDSVKFKGKPTLMYYYGISNNDVEQLSSGGACSDYFYYNFNGVKQKIGFASPFALSNYRDNINDALDNATSGDTKGIYASYLQSIYLNMGTGSTNPTNFSLTFGDSEGLLDTIYTKFYGNRQNRYTNSEVLTASVLINDVDWSRLQFNQAILYKNEIYSLMALKNYDVVAGTANIEMIKMI